MSRLQDKEINLDLPVETFAEEDFGQTERRQSPFVLNLKPEKADQPTPAIMEPAPAAKMHLPEETRRKLPRKWRMMLDERIHLKEMRYRSLSLRPRGWQDLPPREALTLGQAVTITVRRFFTEHPLAELTVLALFRTMAVVTYRLTLRPILSTLPDRYLDWLRPPVPRIKETSPLAVNLALEPEPTERLQTTAKPKLKLPAMPVVSLPKPEIKLPRLAWPSLRLSPTFALASLALAIVLPLGAYKSVRSLNQVRSDAVSQGLLAMQSLKEAQSAAENSDLAGLRAAFLSAEDHFSQAKSRLGALTSVLTAAGSIMPSTSASTAGLMLVAGEQLTAGGERLASGIELLESAASPSEKLKGLEIQLTRAMPHLSRATEAVERMSPEVLPVEYRTTLDQAKAELPRLLDGMDEIRKMSGLLALMLGGEQPQRYLLVFQNNTELRPTGGFIGSFALMDVSQGEIRNLEIPGGGSYDLQGSLSTNLAAPRPLRLINPRWEFQDANWSPDFPTSAARLAWFYEKSGGPTVDGVIAVNAQVMERLLAVVGPVELPEYDVTLTAENFVRETQREVELDYDRETNQPKQILGDLAPIVLERITTAEKESYFPLAETVTAALSQREIQVWFVDPDLQNRSSELGWSGEMRTSSGDYLQLVHTNIAGQKTDGVMTEKIRHDTKILADGSALVTLTVDRTHHGVAGETFTGVRNVDYLRVYVPLGSTLIEAGGFEAPDPKLFQLPDPSYGQDGELARHEAEETTDRRSGTRISTENGKTVFANWVQTDPGETSTVTLTYRLPSGTVERHEPEGSLLTSAYSRLTSSGERRRLGYSLLVQRQSGASPAEFTSSIDLPRGYTTVWASPTHVTDERNREVATGTLSQDLFFGLSGDLTIR